MILILNQNDFDFESKWFWFEFKMILIFIQNDFDFESKWCVNLPRVPPPPALQLSSGSCNPSSKMIREGPTKCMHEKGNAT